MDLFILVKPNYQKMGLVKLSDMVKGQPLLKVDNSIPDNGIKIKCKEKEK